MNRRSYGLRAWILQRLSAVYMTAYLLFFIFHVSANPPHSYTGWHGWMAGPLVSLATALFFIAILVHAWVGVRDVIMDYVKPPGLRFSLLSLIGIVLLACGLWVLRILIQVSQ
jgi:succinate dehydrogenase / fumarate reductase membrane anchor subunit